MAFLWLRGRAELRAQWRTLLLLAVVVGIGGAAALTSFAGARRTDSAMPEFVAYSLPDDGGFLSGSVTSPRPTPGRPADSLAPDPVAQRVLALPQVEGYVRGPFLFTTTDRRGETPATLSVTGIASADALRTVDRPLVLAGHLPAATDPFDAVVNEFAAQARHLHVGSRVRLYAYSYAQVQSGGLSGGPRLGSQAPGGPAFTVRVSAVVRSAQEVDAVRPLADRQGVPYESQQTLYVMPAFVQRYAAGLGVAVAQLPDINLYAVRLRHGAADWPAFSRGATAVAGENVFLSEGNSLSVHLVAASAQRGVHIVVLALLGFGAIVALLTIVLAGQALARQVGLDGPEYAGLRALGATPGQIVCLAVVRAAVIGLAGAVLAVLFAWLASPLMPVGLAREAEVHPGLSFDPTVLVGGSLALAALLTPWAAVPAWRRARAPIAATAGARADVHPEWFRTALAKAGAPPATHIGVHFGLERDTARGGALTAAFAAIVAIAALAAAFTFGSSLASLEGAPRQQGWNWDVLVGNPSSFVDTETAYSKMLARDRFVSGYSAIAILAGANQGNALIDGKLVNLLLAFDPLKGAR